MTEFPRIVIAGEPAEAGLRASLAAAFRRLGCTVGLLDLGPWNPSWLARAALRQPALGAGFRCQFRRMVDACAEYAHADLVLIAKGPLLNRRSIDYLRTRLAAPVVCWNPDSPFDNAISNSGAGIPQAISAYDAYVTWADDVAERLSAVASQVLVIPFAWDPELMRPMAGNGTAVGRIVFIGTGTEERSAMLGRLRHLHPMVYGTRWPNIEGVSIHPPVRGGEFCKVVGEARWNLNLLRPQNARSHNMRTFELVGADGNQVAPKTVDHQKFLGADSRTVLFESDDELMALLQSDPCDRPARPAGVLYGHTYVDRVAQLLGDLGLYIKSRNSSLS